MDSYEVKERGRKNYKGKLKDRGCHKHIESYQKPRVGNAHSVGGHRPFSHMKRVQLKADILDTVNYTAVDRTGPYTDGFDRKTYSRHLISLDPTPKMNQQIGNKTNEKIEKEADPRCVHLKEIHPELYLGNYDYAEMTKDKEFNMIINLSGKPIISKKNRNSIRWLKKGTCIINNFHLPEKTIYKTFEKKILELVKYIQKDWKILINCAAGVNRSAAVIIAYSMINLGWTYQETLEYINKEKEKVDPNWATLTNRQFQRFLLAFQQNHKVIGFKHPPNKTTQSSPPY